MQIHEITEGLLGNMLGAATGNYSGFAQDAAASLQKKGYGAGYQRVDANKIWPEKLKTVQKDPAVQQYINGLIAAWQTKSKTPTNEDDLSTITPANTGGATAADRAALDRAIKAADAKKATTGTTGTTAPAAPGPDTFKTWSDAKLLSRVPGTGEEINMEMVHKLDKLGPQLDQALAKINSAPGTPAATAAMKEYLQLAIAGIQAKSQESKSLKATGSRLSGKYAKSSGNAQADTVLKAAGFTLI